MTGAAVIASTPNELRLATALAGIMLIAFGQGFIFSNALARSMSLFPDRAGVAASLQGCLMLAFGSAACAAASALPLQTNVAIAGLFFALFVVTLIGMLSLGLSRRTAIA